ncbi:SCAN domain-containing protein 3-like [Centruroides vittatus]|uniref:SCAN domain-containing protein 3-like n=1 Tax=Centruroides vittatus TaxID=120091 RepID=UPI00350EBCCC
MSLNTGQNQTQTEFVCKEQFNETIGTCLSERHDKEKPLWTLKGIEAITATEQFKLAPVRKFQRTNKYDLMEVGTKNSLILMRKSNSDPVVKIVPAEEFYHILRETHQSTGHGGRDKMLYSLKSRLYTHFGCSGVFKTARYVSLKKFPRKGIVVRPIVSCDFNHRGQADLVDLQSTPVRNCKWLLHYQDHATKFSFLRPKRAAEVAMELLKIFLEVDCPHTLQSDNSREFAFQKNSSFHCIIQLSPYKALFRTEPKTGLQSTHISKELLKKLVTEEDFDQLLKQQHSDSTLTSKNLPATQLMNNDDASTSELEPVYNSTTPVPPVKTCVLLIESKTEAVDSKVKLYCVVCGTESTGVHSCDICKNPVHAIRGNSIGAVPDRRIDKCLGPGQTVYFEKICK